MKSKSVQKRLAIQEKTIERLLEKWFGLKEDENMRLFINDIKDIVDKIIGGNLEDGDRSELKAEQRARADKLLGG